MQGWGRLRRARVGIAAAIVLMVAAGAGAQKGSDVPRYSAPEPGTPLCTLKIHVTGFRNDKGDAGGTVFASPNGWPEDNSRSLVHGPFPIKGNQATEVFEVPPGRYAVAVIHDENENHKLDRNFLGIPKEGFGFANNPRVLMSAPPFSAAAVEVGCPVTQIEIGLIYK